MSDKKFDLEIATTATGDGAQKTAAGLDQVADSTKKATAATEEYNAQHAKTTEGLREAREALHREGEAQGEIREAAMEATHGLHGAHLAIAGLSEAAQGGEGALHGLMFAFKGVALAAGAGVFGVLALALTGLTELIGHVVEASKKAKEEQEKIADEAENAREKIDETVKEAEKMKKPAEEWEEAIKNADAALDHTLETFRSIHGEMEKLLAAQEKNAIAGIQGRSDLSDEEKRQQVFNTKTTFASLRNQSSQALYDKEIELQKRKIEAQEKAAEDAAQAAAVARSLYENIKQQKNDFADKVAAVKARLDKPAAQEASEFYEQHGLAADTDAQKQGFKSARDRIDKEREALAAWLKEKVEDQIKELEAKKKEAEEEQKKANNAASTQSAKAVEAQVSGGNKIAALEREKLNAKEAREIEQQAADQEESARRRKEAQDEKDKALKQQQETERKNRHETEEAIDRAHQAQLSEERAKEQAAREAEQIVKADVREDEAADKAAAKSKKQERDERLRDAPNAAARRQLKREFAREDRHDHVRGQKSASDLEHDRDAEYEKPIDTKSPLSLPSEVKSGTGASADFEALKAASEHAKAAAAAHSKAAQDLTHSAQEISNASKMVTAAAAAMASSMTEMKSRIEGARSDY